MEISICSRQKFRNEVVLRIQNNFINSINSLSGVGIEYMPRNLSMQVFSRC